MVAALCPRAMLLAGTPQQDEATPASEEQVPSCWRRPEVRELSRSRGAAAGSPPHPSSPSRPIPCVGHPCALDSPAPGGGALARAGSCGCLSQPGPHRHHPCCPNTGSGPRSLSVPLTPEGPVPVTLVPSERCATTSERQATGSVTCFKTHPAWSLLFHYPKSQRNHPAGSISHRQPDSFLVLY